jgi:hypothetical protein
MITNAESAQACALTSRPITSNLKLCEIPTTANPAAPSFKMAERQSKLAVSLWNASMSAASPIKDEAGTNSARLDELTILDSYTANLTRFERPSFGTLQPHTPALANRCLRVIPKRTPAAVTIRACTASHCEENGDLEWSRSDPLAALTFHLRAITAPEPFR